MESVEKEGKERRTKRMVRVYLAEISPLLIEETYQKYFQELPLWRQQKALRIRNAEGRARSVGAWALWQKVQEEWGGVGRLAFNLSHSGKYVLCACSDGGIESALPEERHKNVQEDGACKIGCDLEMVREVKISMAKRFFCPAEYEWIVRHKADQAEWFCRYWVLKESFMKATRRGMGLDTRSFEIGWNDNMQPWLLRKPEEYKENYVYKEYEFLPREMKIAVCTTDLEIDQKLHIRTF